MNTEIPHLKIERLSNGCIRLENESMGDSYTVDIHPLHLRYLAEAMGLVSEASVSDAELLRIQRAEVSMLKAQNERFKRALDHLRHYADKLHTNLVATSRQGHEDLVLETTDALAMINFADYICEEFEDDLLPVDAATLDVSALRTNNPKKGLVEAPQKRGSSSNPNSSTTLEDAAPAQLDLPA